VHTCYLGITVLPFVGRSSSVGIAIRYGMVGPWLDSRGCLYFSYSSKTTLYNGYRVSLAEVKRPGRVVENPTPSNDGVKENIATSLLSPGFSW